jgi:hypothetical protein
MSPSSWGTDAGIGTIEPAVETMRVEVGPALAIEDQIAQRAATVPAVRRILRAVE